MYDDPKVKAICTALAHAMQDMVDHSYRKVEATWELSCFDGSKIVDRGIVYVERQDDGAFAVRITDRYTGSPNIA